MPLLAAIKPQKKKMEITAAKVDVLFAWFAMYVGLCAESVKKHWQVGVQFSTCRGGLLRCSYLLPKRMEDPSILRSLTIIGERHK